MKSKRLDIPAAGKWGRDCELICLNQYKGLKINYHKDSDDTYWEMRFKGVVVYRVIGEEFARKGYLMKLPTDGAFFEILDSPWINEFEKEQHRIIDKCKHFVLEFYDQTLEVIAEEILYEQESLLIE